MYLFDFIHDESPLISEALRQLIDEQRLRAGEMAIVTMGRRWKDFYYEFKQSSMTEFFSDLDKQKLNIDEELRRIAREYDTTNLFTVDRLMIKKPRALQRKTLVYTFLFYEHLFKARTVSHYFTTGIAYMYNLVSYQVAHRYAVRHISFYDIRYPGEKRTTLSLGVTNRFDLVYKKYQDFSADLVTEAMRARLENFRQKPAQPTYMKNLINKQTINAILIKEFFIRFRKYYFERNNRYDYFSRSPFSLSYDKLRKLVLAKLILALSSRIFEKNQSDRDDYFLFPIHMVPEASTLVLAKHYTNQLETIINVAKTLPADVYLYVKEHKSALGDRSLKFYRELKKIPNIKLIGHTENTFDLINKARGIITLSSTVGWEALFFRKPVFVLGHVFYNDAGLTLKIDSFIQLELLIQSLMEDKLVYMTHDFDDRLAYFLDCMLQNSYPFEFNVYKLDITSTLLEKNNVEKCADFIHLTLTNDITEAK